jgi:hypothetical protein
VLALAAVAIGACSCSALADGADSRVPEWSCLDGATAGALSPLGATGPVNVELAFIDLFQAMPLRDVAVRACLAIDSACASPFGPLLRSDEAGRVQLELYRGFDGYLELQGEGLISSLLFLPIIEADGFLETIGLVPEANLRTFNTNFDAGIDFAKGHLVVRIRDCFGGPAESVTLQTDASNRGFFMVGGLPEFTTSESGPTGVGGFLNIDVAAARVVGTLEVEEGAAWSIGAATFAVRPGWVTFGDLGPRLSRP